VPFLLNRVGSRVAAAFAEVLRHHGLTLPMWRVLAAVHKEGSLRAGELAKETGLEPSKISRLLGAMASEGLIARRHLEEDARAVMVHLTGEGRNLIKIIVPQALHVERLAFDGFTTEEIALLEDMLRRLQENVEQLEGTLVPAAGEDLA
jgi:DNA-binding MarR family transcriptional regulator